MKRTTVQKALCGAGLALVAALLLVQVSLADTLSTSVIGMFPRQVEEFAYADLKTARRFPWFPQLKDQLLPSRFRQFEQFLASVGIDPSAQVDELAWAAVLVKPRSEQEGQPAAGVAGEEVVGIALGQFATQSTEDSLKDKKVPVVTVRGQTLFAFGSGMGPGDIFFTFLDSNTAAFGHRAILEKLLDVRAGAEESLLNNERLFPLIRESNGRGVVWAVLDQGYTRLGLQQLLPEAAQFPEAAKLAAKFQAMLISVEVSRDVEARFQAVCATPDDANVFAALLQAGLLYRRFQEQQSNPELAKMLDDARVTPRGERLELRFALTQEQLTALLRRNTFAVKM